MILHQSDIDRIKRILGELDECEDWNKFARRIEEATEETMKASGWVKLGPGQVVAKYDWDVKRLVEVKTE